MILIISLDIIALTYSSVRADQISMTRSKLGNLSESPIETATRLGNVAQCKTIFATQPMVSEEITASLLLKFTKKILNLFIVVFTCKKYGCQF